VIVDKLEVELDKTIKVLITEDEVTVDVFVIGVVKRYNVLTLEVVITKEVLVVTVKSL
jgi:ATP-dependent Clp protease adapter protein ClpS